VAATAKIINPRARGRRKSSAGYEPDHLFYRRARPKGNAPFGSSTRTHTSSCAAFPDPHHCGLPGHVSYWETVPRRLPGTSFLAIQTNRHPVPALTAHGRPGAGPAIPIETWSMGPENARLPGCLLEFTQAMKRGRRQSSNFKRENIGPTGGGGRRFHREHHTRDRSKLLAKRANYAYWAGSKSLRSRGGRRGVGRPTSCVLDFHRLCHLRHRNQADP